MPSQGFVVKILNELLLNYKDLSIADAKKFSNMAMRTVNAEVLFKTLEAERVSISSVKLFVYSLDLAVNSSLKDVDSQETVLKVLFELLLSISSIKTNNSKEEEKVFLHLLAAVERMCYMYVLQ